ncbi:MAG: hypothetical protein AAGJ08_23775 [Cyanobacteria bacterium P01_H01_bin.35]
MSRALMRSAITYFRHPALGYFLIFNSRKVLTRGNYQLSIIHYQLMNHSPLHPLLCHIQLFDNSLLTFPYLYLFATPD